MGQRVRAVNSCSAVSQRSSRSPTWARLPRSGSIVGTRQDLAEVFELHARGRTRVIAETRRLDDVNEAVAEVLEGGHGAAVDRADDAPGPDAQPVDRREQRHHEPFGGTSWKYSAVMTKLTANSSRKVMTTDWFTASPTPLGPPPARNPL